MRLDFSTKSAFLGALSLIVACGAETEKDKPALGQDKSGVERFDAIRPDARGASWTEVGRIESPHPYQNRLNRTWSQNGTAGAIQMRVVFDRFELEDRYDFLYVTGARDDVSRYTGTESGLDLVVDGDRVDLRLSTDGSVTGWGFSARVLERRGCVCPAIFAPVCGDNGQTYSNQCAAACAGATIRHTGACREDWTGLPTNVQSAHPYANNFRRSWTVQEGGASQIRLHFTRLDLERGYDFVRILDANDRLVHEYTGNATDVTTPAIRGSTAKVQLVTDSSVTRWGFAIDRYDVIGGCNSDADCGQNEQCYQVQCIRAPCFRQCTPVQPGYQTVALPSLEQNPAAFHEVKVEVVADPTMSGGACTKIACPASNPCCNQCSAGFAIGQNIRLTDANEQGYTCSGNECTFQNNCSPSFTALNAGSYTLRGTFRHDAALMASTLLVDSFTANTCQAGGCSGQLCANSGGAVSTCEWREEYACYRTATCAAQGDGFCAWTPTPELTQCIASAGNNGPQIFSAPGLPSAVPDNRAGGVIARVSVSGVASANSVRASAFISHTYRGDLKVTLVAPTGREQVLHNQSGGSFDDLVLESVDVTGLSAGAVSGTWQLKVEDLAAADVGTLDAFSLEVR